MSYVVIKPNGDKYRYDNDQVADNRSFYYVFYSSGTEYWYDQINDGRSHRLDGPAVKHKNPNYHNEWWYKGTRIYCTTQEEFNRKIKLLAFL